MYIVILLSVALVAWLVYLLPPLACSAKTAALVARTILAGVVSFGISAALTRALLDWLR